MAKQKKQNLLKKTFVLRIDEVCPVTCLSLIIAGELLKRKDTKHLDPTNHLKTSIKKLRTLLGETNPDLNDKIVLDIDLMIALLYALYLSYSAQRAKKLHGTITKIFKKDPCEGINDLNDAKPFARDLIWRLTQELEYFSLGLEVLENAFDFKPVMRPVEDELSAKTTTLKLSTKNVILITWAFKLLDNLETLKDKNDFAYRYTHCEFLHPDDYSKIRLKLLDCRPDDQVTFTLTEIIILYITISIYSCIFATDASTGIKDLIKSEKIFRVPGETPDKLSMEFLRYADKFLASLRKKHAKEPAFNEYVKAIAEWKL